MKFQKIVAFLIFFCTCAKQPVDFEKDLEFDRGVFLNKETAEPYNGIIVGYHKNGQVKTRGTLKDGVPHGTTTSWFDNKVKKSELRFKKGKNHGLQTFWFADGAKKEEGEYHEGSREGLWTYWHKNGRKKKTGCF